MGKNSMPSDKSRISKHSRKTAQPKQRKMKTAYRNVVNKIDRSQLLRQYIFNFILLASSGSLIPFLPIFFKLIGFSHFQNGLLASARGLVSFWSGHIISSTQHLAVFTNSVVFICAVGYIIDTFSLALVQNGFGGGIPMTMSSCRVINDTTTSTGAKNHPKADRKNTQPSILELEKGFTKLRRSLKYQEGSEVKRRDVFGSNQLLDYRNDKFPRDSGLHSAGKHFAAHKRFSSVGKSEATSVRKHHRRRLRFKSPTSSRMIRRRRRRQHRKKHRKIRNRTKFVHRERLVRMKTEKRIKDIKTHSNLASPFNRPTKITFTTQNLIIQTENSKFRHVNSSVTTSPILTSSVAEPVSTNLSATSSGKALTSNQKKKYIQDVKDAVLQSFPLPNIFFATLAITILSELFYSVLAQKSECVDEVGRYFCPSVFAMNRFCGKLGYGFAAFTVAYVSWRMTCVYTASNTFYFHFYGFVAGGSALLFASLCLPLKEKPRRAPCQQCCASWKIIFCNLQALSFSVTLILVGVTDVLIDAYLLWYASDIGGTELVYGIIITVAVLTDMLFYSFLGISIQWIGHSGLLSFAVILSGAQLIAIPYVRKPYLLIPLQVLRGISTAAAKSAIFDFSNAISPLGSENSVQILFQSIYSGLGVGIGGFHLSVACALYGLKKMFKGMSVVCFIYGTFYSLASAIHFIATEGRPKGNEYEKVQPDVIPENDDWLAEALKTEEQKAENDA